ncbi:MAG: ATP-binding protein, partial [Kitasatospora sp.]|nr:ATP-binding protein [Kitasatospora sp.]
MHASGGGQRPVRLTAGEYQLTVNPVDGTQVEPFPPGAGPAHPARYSPEAAAGHRRATVPPPPPTSDTPPLPLLERDEARERLVRLLAGGRSVRVSGPSGAGRTALLDAVAAECGGFAPDGVIRLSGEHRGVTDLMHQLAGAVFAVADLRPERPQLLQLLQEIGAVVVLDDIGFGGAALDELLQATPECAFLIAAVPSVPAPSPEADIEELFLPGLSRGACLRLLEEAVQRPLAEDERRWAGDLWFESEGLPLRFVQAGGLLRQRDALRAAADAVEDETVQAGYGPDGERPDLVEAPTEAAPVPLPSLGQSAAPASLLASRASAPARQALRFALALDGRCPHHAHLPALAGDTHADTAVAELAGLGLLTAAGGHYRLAAEVAGQLADQLDTDGGGRTDPLLAAAQHYTWWSG